MRENVVAGWGCWNKGRGCLQRGARISSLDTDGQGLGRGLRGGHVLWLLGS